MNHYIQHFGLDRWETVACVPDVCLDEFNSYLADSHKIDQKHLFMAEGVHSELWLLKGNSFYETSEDFSFDLAATMSVEGDIWRLPGVKSAALEAGEYLVKMQYYRATKFYGHIDTLVRFRKGVGFRKFELYRKNVLNFPLDYV